MRERTHESVWNYPRPPAVEPVGERANAQAGAFYGGWITSWIEGPFKGGAGTRGW